jgi:prevent-host-death family protein
MRSVNIAELNNRLSAYITFARAGEEVIIRDRNRPVAKLVPFIAEGLSADDMELVAKGLMKLPEKPMDWEAFSRLPLPRARRGASLTRALLEEREESR